VDLLDDPVAVLAAQVVEQGGVAGRVSMDDGPDRQAAVGRGCGDHGAAQIDVERGVQAEPAGGGGEQLRG